MYFILFVGSGKGSKGFTTFPKSKDACVFPFNADFQFRWNDGGSAAWSAAALEETLDVQSVQAAAAFDCLVVEAPLCCDMAATDFVGESSVLVTSAAGGATIVLGDNGGFACAATDLKDATNS